MRLNEFEIAAHVVDDFATAIDHLNRIVRVPACHMIRRALGIRGSRRGLVAILVERILVPSFGESHTTRHKPRSPSRLVSVSC